MTPAGPVWLHGRPRAARSALVLAAHGSRQDPEANALVERHAEALRSRRLFDEVAAAFHQGKPGFATVLDGLTAEEVTVVPFMTSSGYYSDVVLPGALRQNRRFGAVRLRQTPPLGTHPDLASLVARRAGELLRAHQFDREETSTVVIGHGTRRHEHSRTSTLDLVAQLQRRNVCGEVLAAFLDDEPGLDDLAARLTRDHVLVIPFLVGGAHTMHDVPRALGLELPAGATLPLAGRSAGGSRLIVLDAPLGTHEGITDLLIDLARRHRPAPRRFPQRGGRTVAHRAPGTVHLVGAGPGDPGLITVRGLDALRQADVVIHDRLIGHELLREVRLGAEVIDAGKSLGHAAHSQEEINALLVNRARRGLSVVRLKGGDPFVFGRGSEEVAACREAGVSCRVVPGVTSALAAPAAAGIPITARGVSRSFAVLTAHQVGTGDAAALDVAPLAAIDTLVVLMGRSNLNQLAHALIAAGRAADTPAACIQEATTRKQRVTLATLGTIADAADRDGLQPPVVTVIGQVAALAATLAPEASLDGFVADLARAAAGGD